jgi:chloride channel 7
VGRNKTTHFCFLARAPLKNPLFINTHQTQIFSLPTLAVKFVSCACAVAAGLPVGPEGPMVHMGALIGGGLSQGQSTTLGISAPGFLASSRFRNPKDKRDFVAAGTAVGIATAFGAPIGGLLFAFEELAVPFSPALAAQILAAAAAAVLALNTARSAHAATFGSLDGDASPVFFEVRTQLANHVAAMVPAAGLGAVCGVAAGAFTLATLAWTRARDGLLASAPRRARLVEPIALAAAFAGASLLLAGAWPCTVADCVLPPTAAVGDAPPTCPPPPPGASALHTIADAAVSAFTCGRRHGAAPPVPGPTDPAWGNASSAAAAAGGGAGGGAAALAGPLAFSEAATLALGTGEDAIRVLLSRGTHREFGYGSLLTWLALYSTGAVFAAAAGVASGLFVPMLAIGAGIGRLAGRAAVDAAAAAGAGSAGAPPGVFMSPSPWAWLDPGAFALIGAGAFLGGVTRLTLAAAVIMMEVSNDARSLLPLLVSILASKAVADGVVHPLYHGLLAAKCVPWLPGEPVCSVPLDLVPASSAAAAPVAVADVSMPSSGLRSLLRDTAHHGFPVVRAGAGGSAYVGLISRETCLALLRRAAALGARARAAGGPPVATSSVGDISYEDLNRRYVTAAARSLLSEQQLAVLSGGGGGGGGGLDGASGGADDPVIDLAPYVNTSAPAVPDSFSLGRAYALFVRLGLRHLPLVDGRNRVVGILTRKDLLGCRLDDAAARAVGGGSGGGGVSAVAAAAPPAWAGVRAGDEGGGGVVYGF